MKNKPTNCHHLIPKSKRDEGYNVESEVNKEQWVVNKHNSIHSLFADMLPHDSMGKYVHEYYGSVFRPEFKAKIQEILDWDKEDIYVDEVLKIQSETKQKVMEVLEQEFNQEFLEEMKKPLEEEIIIESKTQEEKTEKQINKERAIEMLKGYRNPKMKDIIKKALNNIEK